MDARSQSSCGHDPEGGSVVQHHVDRGVYEGHQHDTEHGEGDQRPGESDDPEDGAMALRGDQSRSSELHDTSLRHAAGLPTRHEPDAPDEPETPTPLRAVVADPDSGVHRGDEMVRLD